MVNKQNKNLVYITSLQNVIELHVLTPETIHRFAHVPKVILALGVSDLFNVIHRVSQKMILDGVTEHDVKEKVVFILNEMVQKIVEVSLSKEMGGKYEIPTITFDSLTGFDVNFLKDAGIDPDSFNKEV
jgi:hypothetical protein